MVINLQPFLNSCNNLFINAINPFLSHECNNKKSITIWENSVVNLWQGKSFGPKTLANLIPLFFLSLFRHGKAYAQIILAFFVMLNGKRNQIHRPDVFFSLGKYKEQKRRFSLHILGSNQMPICINNTSPQQAFLVNTQYKSCLT